MKRFLLMLFLVCLVFAPAVVPAAAQDAPKGVWLGSWPYVLPPDHTLNAFASNGLDDNLGVMFRSFVELPFAIYKWADNQYEGLLAEKWSLVDDNKAFEVTIKDGAKWSDGKPLTADDVVATWAVGRVSAYLSSWSYLSDVQKVDDRTVRFVFKNEASPLAEHLILKTNISSAATYGDLAKRAVDLVKAGKDNTSDEWKKLADDITNFKPETLIASGPYTYDLKDVGAASMLLHWQPNSLYSSSVKFGTIKIWQGETEQTTPLVLSGELAHSTDVYPPSTIDQFKSQGIRLVTIPRGYGPALLFNHSIAPWNVKEVRQAAALVINREQNAFLTGAGAVATKYMSGILDDNVPQLLPQDVIDKLDPYTFDTDRASKLLESVGYTKNADGKWADKDGKTIAAEFKFPAEFADFSGAAQDAIAQLNAFGFDITARSTPWQETAKAIRESNFQLSVWSWANQSPFASRQFFGPIQRFNKGHLAEGQNGIDFPMQFKWNGEDVDLDKMITDASNSLDENVRKERAGKVALIINDLMPFIPLNVEQSVEPLNEKYISGAPADDDPILKNPTGSDHWIILYLLQGKLSPTDADLQVKP
jgi:peptide/nickel transport system substrate-binding protein